MPNTIDRRMRLKVAFAPQAIATSGEHAIAEMRWFPVQEPVGRLGILALCPGYYLRVGSAFGPGGLRARIAHHARRAALPH